MLLLCMFIMVIKTSVIVISHLWSQTFYFPWRPRCWSGRRQSRGSSWGTGGPSLPSTAEIRLFSIYIFALSFFKNLQRNLLVSSWLRISCPFCFKTSFSFWHNFYVHLFYLKCCPYISRVFSEHFCLSLRKKALQVQKVCTILGSLSFCFPFLSLALFMESFSLF